MQELSSTFGIVFNGLLCLNNMPIKRFADFLLRRGQLDSYMQLLVTNYNVAATEGLMCRDTVSVGWDGSLFDCDFNQQLDINMMKPPGRREGKEACSARSSGQAQTDGQQMSPSLTVFDIDTLDSVVGWRVATDNHCFGCTAGSGSGCQGATA